MLFSLSLSGTASALGTLGGMLEDRQITVDMNLISKYNNQIFKIEKDNPEIGFYLFVFNDNNECTHDYLQDTEQMTKEFAFEEFGVPLDSWILDN